jgi:stalled ribosome alternative rescue factor ArfA
VKRNKPGVLSDAQRADLALIRAARREARLAAPRQRAATIPARKGPGSYRRKPKHGGYS